MGFVGWSVTYKMRHKHENISSYLHFHRICYILIPSISDGFVIWIMDGNALRHTMYGINIQDQLNSIRPETKGGILCLHF